MNVGRAWQSQEGNSECVAGREPQGNYSGNPGNSKDINSLEMWLDQGQRMGPWDPVGHIKSKMKRVDTVPEEAAAICGEAIEDGLMPDGQARV
jgi:hypothetical protein